MAATNMEEAAVITADYISSLDNLPQEIAHLLAEIKHKDLRVQEIQQDIQKESQKYVRHSKREGTPMTPRDAQIPQKIEEYFRLAEKITDEKIELAQRINALITRTRARLDHDLARVLEISGEESLRPSSTYVNTTRSAAQLIQDQLRAASISLPEAVPITPVTTTASAPPAAPPPKRRKLGQTQSVAAIKLPSPAPMAAAPTRARIAQQQSHRPSPARGVAARKATSPLGDEDAEGEDDDEAMADGNDDDEALYCFCQKPSYGEMIGCENDECAYEWFHLDCVKVKPPLPDHWYCADCLKKKAGQALAPSAPQKKKKR
ncbi:hypothetical protein K488DRAFT_75992 [Vararia minispora EC-137]|uniref:Uncharacterized protein n=1 Tax=Vararia minispora EC-137 TaxID=1314806 RepID=A0ACB8QXU8_9AGAM|nr:hypothetical protein K488DRAFT_75992 [Vararia minispora EC-137]